MTTLIEFEDEFNVIDDEVLSEYLMYLLENYGYQPDIVKYYVSQVENTTQYREA